MLRVGNIFLYLQFLPECGHFSLNVGKYSMYIEHLGNYWTLVNPM